MHSPLYSSVVVLDCNKPGYAAELITIELLSLSHMLKQSAHLHGVCISADCFTARCFSCQCSMLLPTMSDMMSLASMNLSILWFTIVLSRVHYCCNLLTDPQRFHKIQRVLNAAARVTTYSPSTTDAWPTQEGMSYTGWTCLRTYPVPYCTDAGVRDWAVSSGGTETTRNLGQSPSWGRPAPSVRLWRGLSGVKFRSWQRYLANAITLAYAFMHNVDFGLVNNSR